MDNNSFWGNNPAILLNKNEIFELFPTSNMNYNQKLNSVTRLIILLTVIGFIFTFSINILLAGLITIGIIYIYFYLKYKEGFSKNETKHLANTYGKQKILNPETLEETMKEEFYPNKSTNPFSNVLLPEISYNTNRKAAPPSFNPDVYEEITRSTKQMVQDLNPGIINTNKQLFGDLGENFNLDQSNRAFYSTANTRVTNDQGAYAKYLYGDMPSCRGGDTIQCVKDNYRYILY
jgi:hypothetical protein